jgi:hypothetical protein
MKFLLWCILLVLCWPLALAALVIYPLVWLILLPFRLVGIAVEGALELVWAIVTLPARMLRALISLSGCAPGAAPSQAEPRASASGSPTCH